MKRQTLLELAVQLGRPDAEKKKKNLCVRYTTQQCAEMANGVRRNALAQGKEKRRGLTRALEADIV